MHRRNTRKDGQNDHYFWSVINSNFNDEWVILFYYLLQRTGITREKEILSIETGLPHSSEKTMVLKFLP